MKLLTLIMLFIFSNIIIATESIVPTIQLVESANPCGSFEDRRITVLVDIGKVNPSHQLYGFEFGIGIDTSKIVFDNLIKQTTMLEYFGEYITVSSSGNLITGGGGLLQGGPISGERPLFAVSFRLKEGIFDETYIRLNYLYMYEEYTNIIDLTKDDTLQLNFDIKDNTLRDFEFETQEEYAFNSTKIIEIPVSFDTKNLDRLNYLSINHMLDSSSYVLKDIYSNNWEISIEGDYSGDWESISEESLISLERIANEEEADITMVIEQTSDSEAIFEMNVLDANISSCMKTNATRSINLMPFNEIIKSVEENTLNNDIEVKAKTVINRTNSGISIYDILGNKLFEGDDRVIQLDSGFYLILQNNNHKKIIIN